ncbi:MAG: hypothetical protein Ct9H90mP28_1160 [Paracoccaceae bacterium]|nr:MAG: hypothetical protein Ct9H90mP28_1160 [Paracoccaceae bacterium]
METRSMRRNKYTMEQIDRLEQSNQELLEKNQTLQETNSVLSHALSVVSKSTHIPTQIYTLPNTPSLKEKMQLRRSVRVANFRRQRTTSMG